MAPAGASFATRVALVPPFHAVIVPSSLEKMKNAGPLAPSAKSDVSLATIPVGEAKLALLPGGSGILTTKSSCPSASLTVEKPELLSEIQNGAPGKKAIPQGFLRSGS